MFEGGAGGGAAAVLIQLLLCMSYTSVSRVSVPGLAGGSTDIGFQ